MNCTTCNYALWNLRTRTCPECGESFDPRDYEFVPASVRFCCPHCNQAYYGTDAKGHLVPQEFECVTCGKQIGMAEMVVLPAEGVHERETAPLIVPWLARRDIGFFRGWMRTIGWGFAYGPQIGRGLEATSAPWQAIAFAALTLASVLAGLFLPVGCFSLVSVATMQGGMSAGTFFYVGLVCVGVFASILVGLGVGSLIAHGVLRMFGVGSGQLGRTTEAINYACGPMVVVAVPCFGFYLSPIGWVWWAISAALALAEAHRTKVWKCVVAMLVPAVFVPAMPIGAYAIFIWSIIGGGMLGPGGIMAQAASQSGASTMTMAWRVKASAATAPTPMHASEFLDTAFVDPSDFLSMNSLLLPEDIAIGSLTLGDFTEGAFSLTPEQAEAVAEASAALPTNVIAHRLGDFVFTYHGIDPTTAPQQLWVVIAIDSPDPTAPPGIAGYCTVGTVSGGTETIRASKFADELAAQNGLRAGYGLAPLPSPETVTPEQPAVADGN